MPSANNIRIAKNTMYMYLRMFVILLVSLYTTRIVFNVLGVEDYGIYNVVGGIIVFFTFINSSLTGATQRYITAELAEGTLESQREVFSAAILSHLLIGLLIVLLGETIGLWFLNSVMNIPGERMAAANVVYQLSIFSTFLSVLQAPFNATIIAHEKMSVYAYFSIFDVFFKLGIAFLIQAITGDKLIIYALLIFVAGLLGILLYRIYCYRTFQMCRFRRTQDRHIFKGLFSYMGWALFGTATFVGTNQGVTMLVNYFNGVIVNAAMGVSNQIVSVVSQFVGNFQAAFRPQIVKNYVVQDGAELTKLTIRASRMSAYLILILLIPICFEIKDFLGIWLGDYPEYAVEFCILTLVCVYFESICNPLITLITADKHIKKYQLTVSLIYATNILFCWIGLSQSVVPYMVIAVRLAVDGALVAARLLLMRKQWYDFPIRQWLQQVILKPLLVMVIPVAISLLSQKIPIHSVWARLFVLSGISFVACASCIFVFLLEKEERAFILRHLSKLDKFCNTVYYLLTDKRKVLVVNAFIRQLGGRVRHNNIGDDLNVVLLHALSGKKILAYRSFYHFRRTPENIMAIGSVIEWMGNEKTTVWGAGMLEDPAEKTDAGHPVPLEKVCAVRGKKTRDGLLNAGVACPEVYGDPALLMPLIYRPPVQKVKGRVGIIPHYVDLDHPQVGRLLRELGNDGVLIPVRGYKRWQDVIDLICSCEFVLSSSLHGLILADAYGTANQWVQFSHLLTGGSFKFEDYYSVAGKEARPVVIDDKTGLADLLDGRKRYEAYHFDPLPLLRACPFEITHPGIRRMLEEYE